MSDTIKQDNLQKNQEIEFEVDEKAKISVTEEIVIYY